MLQRTVHYLMHHYEIKLVIVQIIQERRTEIDLPSVGAGCLTSRVDREIHMHEKQTVESVITKDPHPRQQYALYVFAPLLT